jgi:hypothetical protein
MTPVLWPEHFDIGVTLDEVSKPAQGRITVAEGAGDHHCRLRIDMYAVVGRDPGALGVQALGAPATIPAAAASSA